MQEGWPKNNEEGRESVIKAHAQLDAMAYVKLMRERFPEKLKLNEQGEIILGAVEAEPIMGNTRKVLGLSTEEMATYLVSLVKEVERILKSDSNLMDLN